MISLKATLNRTIAFVGALVACSGCVPWGVDVIVEPFPIREKLDQYIGKPLAEARSLGILQLDRGLYDHDGVADQPSPAEPRYLERRFYLAQGWRCEMAFQYAGKPSTIVSYRFITSETDCVSMLSQHKWIGIPARM
jgi:hypothetical protein